MSKSLPAGFADTFQIVHSIPGRMRIAAPQLAELAKRHRGVRSLVALIRSRLEALAHINSVTFSHITGSILIKYQHDSLDESQLLELLRETAHAVVKQQDTLVALLNTLREQQGR